MPALAGQERQVVQRIPIDDDEIRVSAGRDHTELAFLLDDLGGVDVAERMTSIAGSTSPRRMNSSD